MKAIFRHIKTTKLRLTLKKEKIHILWYPRIESKKDLERELARLVWYLTPMLKFISSISIVIREQLESDYDKFIVPDYLDSTINAKFFEIKPLIELIFDINLIVFPKYHVIVQWNTRIKRDNTFSFYLDARIYDNQFESIQIAKFSKLFMTAKEKSYNKKKVKIFLDTLKQKNYNDVLLIGSGPSTNEFEAMQYDSKKTLTIICNSVIKNKNLLVKLQPKIIVATDTVFHSGYSRYAQVFRNSLSEAMHEDPNLVFFVPLRELKLYQKHLSNKLHSRIYGIEGKNIKNFNLNLRTNTILKSTSNVLTFFLLPLATSIAQNINMLGFDGKKEGENDKFWSYAQDSQFENDINSTKLAHPAFYKVDYQAYNLKHIQELNAIIQIMISKGYNVKSLARSNIQVLDKLYD